MGLLLLVDIVWMPRLTCDISESVCVTTLHVETRIRFLKVKYTIENIITSYPIPTEWLLYIAYTWTWCTFLSTSAFITNLEIWRKYMHHETSHVALHAVIKCTEFQHTVPVTFSFKIKHFETWHMCAGSDVNRRKADTFELEKYSINFR